MIDYESQIYTKVETALTAAFPNVTVASVEDYNPSALPFVSVVEIDNQAYALSRDTDSNENHAVLVYEINVMSDKRGGRKSNCKAITAVVDSAMQRMGFTRLMSNPVSLDDATKYRMVLRYTAIISKNGVIYRR